MRVAELFEHHRILTVKERSAWLDGQAVELEVGQGHGTRHFTRDE